MVRKPNQTIPKAPLQPLPAVQEPFSRILVDFVGSLPKAKRGNQYLSTIMSIHHPEAVPLSNIRAKAIVRALTKLFTLVGLLSSIQSDQGSNYTVVSFKYIRFQLHSYVV